MSKSKWLVVAQKFYASNDAHMILPEGVCVVMLWNDLALRAGWQCHMLYDNA